MIEPGLVQPNTMLLETILVKLGPLLVKLVWLKPGSKKWLRQRPVSWLLTSHKCQVSVGM